MRYADAAQRLAGLGGAKWTVHRRARALAAEGRDVIELTIGEPDLPVPAALIETAVDAMRAGRTGYADARGEPKLREAVAARYARLTGRPVAPDQVLCFPGAQTALYAVMQGLVGPGDEVLVADPHYATYEGVIRAAGARMAPVPLRPERGFRLSAADVEARLTAASRAILLNTPHNPTGAVLTRDDIRAIGALATAHDLWIVSDEVYEELVFDERRLPSPFAEPTIADRTVAISSISKSHAATGFRSGWAVASRETAEALLPLSETMLFGNQPFIADMTAAALSGPPDAAAEMRRRFSRRAALLTDRLGGGALRVHPPEAGMFALVDIRATGMGSETYAEDLLETRGVAVMPGTSFGQTLEGWVRVALTAPDEILACACDRMAAHAAALRAPA